MDYDSGGALNGVETISAGVHRIPLPLPGSALKAVNVYAIEESTGITLIDAGWSLKSTADKLEGALAELGYDFGAINQFLITHIHRDHYELSMHIRRLFGTKVSVGWGEEPSLSALIYDDPTGHRLLLKRLIVAGAHALAEAFTSHISHEAIAVDVEYPDRWLGDRQVIELGNGRMLEVIATPGHTSGHVVFLDRQGRLLFAGDHVLPTITPSIGYEAAPQDTALTDYMASLERVRLLPDVRLLPAHGLPRATTHDRIQTLLAHHEERLLLSRQALRAGGSTAYEVAETLRWTRRDRRLSDLDVQNQMLAVNETVAHLATLVDRGLAVDREEEGVRVYMAIGQVGG